MFTSRENKNNDSKSGAFPAKGAIFFQAKLSINTPGDEYEQEADAMADKVMRMPMNNQPFFTPKPTPVSHVQRKCAHCQEEEKLQRKENKSQPTEVSSETSSYINSLSSKGSSVPESARSFFEPRFGYDFSDVKVHDDSEAAKSANSINALAYTTGSNIVFNQNQFSPESDGGKKLLAHELTHVMQQRAGASKIQRYTTPEHIYLGDEAVKDLLKFSKTKEGEKWFKDNGYNIEEMGAEVREATSEWKKIKTPNNIFTPGQIGALTGDLFDTETDLWLADSEQIKSILETSDKEKADAISSARGTVEYSKATQGEYLELAKKNEKHFSPNNQAEWLRLHKIAQSLASTSEDFERAMFMEAAAEHYLSDAFASGHLMNKAAVVAETKSYLHETILKPDNPEMRTVYQLLFTDEELAQVGLRIIHDHFNESGIDVRNKRGMKWKTYGDDHLKNSEITRHMIALAIVLSRHQIIEAKKGKILKPDEVMELFPDDNSRESATEMAIAYIPTAFQYLDQFVYQNKEVIETKFGPFRSKMIEAYIKAKTDPLVLKNSDSFQLQTGGNLSPLFALGDKNDHISLLFGKGIDKQSFNEIFKYRFLLKKWFDGHLQMRAGIDFTFKIDPKDPESDLGLMVEIHGKTGKQEEWFGGWIADLELGLGGSYKAYGGESVPEAYSRYGAGIILKSGAGAEFYVRTLPKKPSDMIRVPVSVEFVYEMWIPLNDSAKKIQALSLEIGVPFDLL